MHKLQAGEITAAQANATTRDVGKRLATMRAAVRLAKQTGYFERSAQTAR
jgi:hypothetical protein